MIVTKFGFGRKKNRGNKSQKRWLAIQKQVTAMVTTIENGNMSRLQAAPADTSNNNIRTTRMSGAAPTTESEGTPTVALSMVAPLPLNPPIVTQPQNDLKKLVEYLLSDLRNLSTEAKKKYNHVKEAAESGIVKVRNISSGSAPGQLIHNLRAVCAEIIHPLMLGCSSKNPRLVQISLQAIQHMLQFRVIDANASSVIVNELWQLTEAECEELRVLQTVTPFVSTEMLVTDVALSKCIVLAIKLNFSKDPSVINAASAAVRQLFSCVFERVMQENGSYIGDKPVDEVRSRASSGQSLAPSTLRPAAADGFLLLKDLILLIRKENPLWLCGVKRITITLALELLESVLKNYPSIFYQHEEYAELLRHQICPQVIKLFAGEKQFQATGHPEPVESVRTSSGGSQTDVLSIPTRPIFPILMRSLRIALALLTNYHSLLVLHNEVIIGYLIELTYTEGFPWQTAMSLEILHKILTQPNFLFWLCQNYERQPNAAKLIRLILQSIVSYIRKALDEVFSNTGLSDGSQYFGQSGFQYNGTFIPLHESLAQRRWIFFRLDSLEKHEPGPVPDGYCLSIAYMCLVDCAHSVYTAVEDKRQMQAAVAGPTDGEWTTADIEAISRDLFLSSFRYLLTGLSTLLECSADDSISDAILNCISTLTFLACRFNTDGRAIAGEPSAVEGATEAKELALRALCEAALPPGYFQRFVQSTAHNAHVGNINFAAEPKDSSSSVVIPSHVVAMGTICPVPSLPSAMLNSNVMLTSKNMQVTRILIACAQQNGQLITDCWDVILTTLQHLIWILGMKPTSADTFRAGGDTMPAGSSANGSSIGAITSGNVILTTMVSVELPDLNSSLNKLFESTITYDDVSLHHVIASLCKLSSESMLVAQSSLREPSLFAVAKLLQTALINLSRLTVYWKPVTAHLLEICAHTNVNLRDWGTMALSTLVKSGLKQVISNNDSAINGEEVAQLSKNEQLILTPLASMSEIEFVEVKTRQLDCLMHILQFNNHELCPEIWPMIVEIVNAIVYNCANAQLIEQGYQTMSLMIKELLNIMPFECIRMLVETDARYGKQQIDLNVSLSAVGQLWDISDYVRRESGSARYDDADVVRIWLVLYTSLGELCIDPRPPIRKSACDTLLQTVAAHGHALDASTWRQMVGKILFPILDRVQELTQSASTELTSTSAFGASNIMIHHSRDTDAKQWSETTVKTLSGVVKIFNSQRSILITLDCFADYWSHLLAYIESVVASGNSEMSLAALKNFQELLFGRQQQVADAKEKLFEDPSLPPLFEKLWLVSWRSWLRIARQISFPFLRADSDKVFSKLEDTEATEELKFQTSLRMKNYIPSPFHLTTLLNIFILLFNRIGQLISIDDFHGELNVPEIFKDISSIPLSAEQAPFTLNSVNSELSLTQECLLDCIQAIVQEQLNPNSRIRAAIPDMLWLLLKFVGYAIRPPQTKFQPSLANATVTNSGGSASSDSQFQWAKQNLIAFAELSLRTTVEYYSKVAAYAEIVERAVLVDIVKRLHEPLALKYYCSNQSTWKLAATSLIKVCQVGLPIARDHPDKFVELWPELATAIESFLFSTSKPSVRLNADERKRHEFVDCMIIELLRTEIMPFAAGLPWDFMQRIIDILNRGSINTMDVNDVMASDSFQHRADLSRVCFDALLSISRSDSSSADAALSKTPKTSTAGVGSHRAVGGGVSPSTQRASDTRCSPTMLGATAIMSLLNRCKQVLNNYARDEQNSGHFRLPQERIFEAISVLRAVSALIDGLTKHAEDAHSTLYSNLVALYPDLVQMIPSCRSDQQLELALMTALNSYQTLFLISIHTF